MDMEPHVTPLFVTGPSRSGTAMVRSALNNHPDIFLAGETHYFDDLRQKVAGYETGRLSPELRDVVEEYFLALGHRPYGHQGDPDLSRLDRCALRRLAEDIGLGADAYFEAYCRLDGGGGALRYWGEKTPRHIYRIAEIAKRYPSARFICMVRDPRAVVASYRDWKNQGGFDTEADPGHAEAIATDEARARQSYHLVTNSLLWRSAANAARQAESVHGSAQVLVQRYEQFVEDPERALRGVADWLDVPFVSEMLNVPMHNSSFTRFNIASGVSTEPIQRWRRTLSPAEVATIQRVCGSAMETHGYQKEVTHASRRELMKIWTTFPVSALKAVGANRSRIGNLPSYVWQRARLVRSK